jgi:hypothetical protein
MQLADQGISNVRRGVERAAESVLGDEAEALRRAQSEVERLAQELNREISQARGEEPSNATDDKKESEQAGESENRRDNRQSGDSGDQEQPAEQQGRNEGQSESQQTSQSNQRGGRGRGDSQQEDQEAQQNQSEESQQQGGQRGEGGRGGSNRGENENQQRGDQARDEQAEAGEGERSREGDNRSGQNDGQNRERSSLRGGGGGRELNREGGIERFLNPGGPGGGEELRGPITGENFREWADRLRDVEEMLDDADLRDAAASIRDRAEDARQDFRKHAKEPDWTKLQDLVADPLVELSQRIDEAIRRLESPDALVPIDRDPVPPEFVEQVRRYYERLGSGE